MGPRNFRVLNVVMTDQDFEALRKKLMETYSVKPTLSNPTVKRTVDWHCVARSCFFEGKQIFDKRENWLRHHQRLHNQNCGTDKGYPREIEARQFIQELERRKNGTDGIAGAGGSAGLPPTATPAGPYSPISGALQAIPLNSAAPSSSTSGALCGASRQEHADQGFVNIAALRDEPESSVTLDAAQREILMQQLSYNLQAVSQINADSVQIMKILGLPSTNCVSEIHRQAGSKRPRESPSTGVQEYPATIVATPVPLPTWVDRRALTNTSRGSRVLQTDQSKFAHAASFSQALAHSKEGPAHLSEAPLHLFKATPYPSQAPAHSNEGPAHPSQGLALSIGGPAHSYEGPPLSIKRPAHPYEAPALSIEDPAYLALTYMTRSQPEEKEEEENYNAASDSDRVGSDDEYQAADVSQDVYEGQVQWKDVKVGW